MISILALLVFQGGIDVLESRDTGLDPFLGNGEYFPLGVDLDGDGHEDFIRSTSSSGGIQVRLADGSYLYLDQSGGYPGNDIWIANEIVNCPDLESDGLPNALAQVYVGNGLFQRCTINIDYLSATPTAEISLLDSPGPGDENEWEFGGNWYGAPGQATHSYPDAHIYGDVGADGDPDVLVSGYATSTAQYYVAAISLTSGELYRINTPSKATILPDLNGDDVPEFLIVPDLFDGLTGAPISTGGMRRVECVLSDITGDGVEEILWRNNITWEAFDLVSSTVVWERPWSSAFTGPYWSHLGGRPNLLFSERLGQNTEVRNGSPLVDMETGETIVKVSGGYAATRHPCRWYNRVPPSGHPTSGFEPLAGGYLRLMSLPCMSSPDSGLSSSSGGIFGLEIDFTEAYANDVYRVLFSSSSGSTNLHGDLEVPLGFTDMLIDSYFGIYPSQLSQGMEGTLDSSGKAFGAIGALAGQIPVSAVGLTIYCAAIVRDYGSAFSASSVAVPILLSP